MMTGKDNLGTFYRTLAREVGYGKIVFEGNEVRIVSWNNKNNTALEVIYWYCIIYRKLEHVKVVPNLWLIEHKDELSDATNPIIIKSW